MDNIPRIQTSATGSQFSRYATLLVPVILTLPVMVMSFMPETVDHPWLYLIDRLPDKLLHFVFYLLITVTSVGVLAWTRQVRVERVVAVVVVISLFGLMIELLQPYAGRTRSLHDYVMNELGIASGLVSYYLVVGGCRLRRIRQNRIAD